MRISDWSSDVCSSDLQTRKRRRLDELAAFLVARSPPLQAEASGEGRLARRHNNAAERALRGVALGRVVALGLAQMRDRIVRLSVAVQRCDDDEDAEVPAGVDQTPCAPWDSLTDYMARSGLLANKNIDEERGS